MIVFFDFDNTITMGDVFDNMLLKFSEDNAWRDLEERWRGKEIGSRECLEGQIKTVSVTRKSLDAYLSRIKLDPYFKKLLRFLRAKRVKTVVLSDNFDYLLNRILIKNGIRNLKVYSNKAELANGRLMPNFPFTDRKCRVCAHCKKKNLLSNINGHSPVIYIGDGQSDICPANYADKVFAKDSLLDYCRKNRLPHIPYKSLKKVYRYLKKECENGQNRKT